MGCLPFYQLNPGLYLPELQISLLQLFRTVPFKTGTVLTALPAAPKPIFLQSGVDGSETGFPSHITLTAAQSA